MKRLLGLVVALGLVITSVGVPRASANASQVAALDACTASQCTVCNNNGLKCKWDTGECYCV